MKLVVTTYQISLPIQKTIHAVLLTDLHNDKRAPIIETIDSIHPDCVLIGGDLIENDAHGGGDTGLAFLRTAAQKYPVFYGIGNHERFLTEENFQNIQNTGATLLRWESIRFGELNIGAVDGTDLYSQENQSFLKKFSKEDGCRILLCHRPEWYAKCIKNFPIPLILSGHAHGGQMRIFGIPLYSPGQGIFPKYTSGIYEQRLVVSRGISSYYRRLPRFGNPPELLHLILAPQNLI